MYNIDGDINFDDYSIELESDYINKDFDEVCELNQERDNDSEDSDIQFE